MNIEQVERIVALMGEFPLSEISLEQEGRRIVARRTTFLASNTGFVEPAVPMSYDGAPAAEGGALPAEELPEDHDTGPVDEEPLVLTSPMVGLFHHAPTPIRYGVLLAHGQIVGAIESMKLMNDVQADQVGRVVDVLVEDGAPVEYGQPLFRVMPS